MTSRELSWQLAGSFRKSDMKVRFWTSKIRSNFEFLSGKLRVRKLGEILNFFAGILKLGEVSFPAFRGKFPPTAERLIFLKEYERCFKQNTRNGRYFRVLGYNTDNVTWRVTNKVLGKITTAAAPKRIAIALLLEHPHLYIGHAFRRTSATLCAESGMSLAEIKLVTGNGIRKLI